MKLTVGEERQEIKTRYIQKEGQKYKLILKEKDKCKIKYKEIYNK